LSDGTRGAEALGTEDDAKRTLAELDARAEGVSWESAFLQLVLESADPTVEMAISGRMNFCTLDFSRT